MIETKLVAIVDAAILYAQANLGDLSLVSCGWAKQMVSTSPVYPHNPRSSCSKLEFRALQTDFLAMASQGIDFDYGLTLTYYKRQARGQDHQRLMLLDLKLIEETFMRGFRPSPMQAAGADLVVPLGSEYIDELRNPRIDDPELRVSVGQFALGIKASGRL